MAQYASGRHAKAVCDVCGFVVPYRSLRQQYRDQKKTNLWVCSECVDRDPSRRLGPISDPQTLHHPRPDNPEASRRILHWRPVDTFQLFAELGEFEVITNAS